MKKTIDHYISELLFLHDCVILPNFGGFVSNPQSAQLNKITGVLTPPSKKILFNSNLTTNDGLLITHVANQERISQDSAKEKVIYFAAETLNKLTISKVLRIEKVGLFTLGKEKNITFIQDHSNNYSLESFGMKSTHNKIISRVNEVEDKAISTIKNINFNNSSTQFMLKAAAILLPLFALAYLSVSQEDKINDIYTQMATFQPFSSARTINTSKEINIETTFKSEELKTVLEKEEIISEFVEEIQPIILTEKNFHIIGGAFAKKKNALRLQAKLNNLDYNSSILNGGRLLKVSYNSYATKDEADLALIKIRRENPSAWILKK